MRGNYEIINELVTVMEAAEIYGCTRVRIYQLMNEGRLRPAYESPQKKLFFRRDVELLSEMMKGGKCRRK